jgi:hypothetical protein
MRMNIKRQDVVVVLKLLASGWPGSYAALGQQLGISASEANAAFHRARRAGLIDALSGQPNKSAVQEFLIHGLKYVLAVRPGGRTRGMLTGFAAAPLAASFRVSLDDPDLPVWPDPAGEASGVELRPIHPAVPQAARQDPKLYEWLVLADALRGAGRARERELAERMVRQRLEQDASG